MFEQLSLFETEDEKLDRVKKEIETIEMEREDISKKISNTFQMSIPFEGINYEDDFEIISGESDLAKKKIAKRSLLNKIEKEISFLEELEGGLSSLINSDLNESMLAQLNASIENIKKDIDRAKNSMEYIKETIDVSGESFYKDLEKVEYFQDEDLNNFVYGSDAVAILNDIATKLSSSDTSADKVFLELSDPNLEKSWTVVLVYALKGRWNSKDCTQIILDTSKNIEYSQKLIYKKYLEFMDHILKYDERKLKSDVSKNNIDIEYLSDLKKAKEKYKECISSINSYIFYNLRHLRKIQAIITSGAYFINKSNLFDEYASRNQFLDIGTYLSYNQINESVGVISDYLIILNDYFNELLSRIENTLDEKSYIQTPTEAAIYGQSYLLIPLMNTLLAMDEPEKFSDDRFSKAINNIKSLLHIKHSDYTTRVLDQDKLFKNSDPSPIDSTIISIRKNPFSPDSFSYDVSSSYYNARWDNTESSIVNILEANDSKEGVLESIDGVVEILTCIRNSAQKLIGNIKNIEKEVSKGVSNEIGNNIANASKDDLDELFGENESVTRTFYSPSDYANDINIELIMFRNKEVKLIGYEQFLKAYFVKIISLCRNGIKRIKSFKDFLENDYEINPDKNTFDGNHIYGEFVNQKNKVYSSNDSLKNIINSYINSKSTRLAPGTFNSYIFSRSSSSSEESLGQKALEYISGMSTPGTQKMLQHLSNKFSEDEFSTERILRDSLLKNIQIFSKLVFPESTSYAENSINRKANKILNTKFGLEHAAVKISQLELYAEIILPIINSDSKDFIGISEKMKKFIVSLSKNEVPDGASGLESLLNYCPSRRKECILAVSFIADVVDLDIPNAANIIFARENYEAIIYELHKLNELNFINNGKLIDCFKYNSKKLKNHDFTELIFIICEFLHENAFNSQDINRLCSLFIMIASSHYTDGLKKSVSKRDAIKTMLEARETSRSIMIQFSSKNIGIEKFSLNFWNEMSELGINLGDPEEVSKNIEDTFKAFNLSKDIFKDSSIGASGMADLKNKLSEFKLFSSLLTISSGSKKYLKESKNIQKNEKMNLLNFELCDGNFRFRVMKKNDKNIPRAGILTSCCQFIGGAGSSCVYDAMGNSESSILVLEMSPKVDLEELKLKNKLRSGAGISKGEDGWVLISQSYFHIVDKEVEIKVNDIEKEHNRIFVLDNIESAFLNVSFISDICNTTYENLYVQLSEHVKENGFGPIICGKSFTRFISDAIDGKMNVDPRSFHYEKETGAKPYTDFSYKDFYVFDKKEMNKEARAITIDQMFRLIKNSNRSLVCLE